MTAYSCRPGGRAGGHRRKGRKDDTAQTGVAVGWDRNSVPELGMFIRTSALLTSSVGAEMGANVGRHHATPGRIELATSQVNGTQGDSWHSPATGRACMACRSQRSRLGSLSCCLLSVINTRSFKNLKLRISPNICLSITEVMCSQARTDRPVRRESMSALERSGRPKVTTAGRQLRRAGPRRSFRVSPSPRGGSCGSRRRP